jgi:hypothetical protein
MKKLIFLLLLIPAIAFALEAQLPGGNKPIQTFAPDGTYASTLTTPNRTVNLADNNMFSVYSVSGTCMMRLMPTTTRAPHVPVLIPNGVWHTYAKNPATPFVNLSGCVTGYLQRQ